MGKVFVSGVARKVNGVDKVHVKPQELEWKDGGSVSNIAVYDVRLNGENPFDLHGAAARSVLDKPKDMILMC